MNIQSLIQSYIAGTAARKISEITNLPEDTVENYVQKAIPFFAGALLKNMSTQEGRDSLFDAIKNDHDGSVFEQSTDVLKSEKIQEGAKILGHVFGGDTTDTEVKLARETGVTPEQSHEMLSALAPMMMGALGKEQGDKGLGMDDVMGMVMGNSGAADMAKKGFSLLKLFKK